MLSYTAPEHREATRSATRERLWEVAQAAEAGTDAQLQLVSAACSLTTSGDDTAFTRSLLEGTAVLDGLTVDFEMRWTLLTALAAAGDADAVEIDAERAREDTATGRERAARARAARPTVQAKQEAWSCRRRGAPAYRTPSSTPSPTGSAGRARRPSCCRPSFADTSRC